MKKSFLSIVLGLATTIAFGQIEAGTKILGGTFSFYSNNDKTETTGGGTTVTSETPSSSFSIVPSFGYMLKDNMGAGIRLGINNSSSGPDSNKYTMNRTIVGLFGRYYVPVAGDNLFFHTDLVLDFGFGTNKQETKSGGTSVTNEVKVNSTSIGLRPGWDFFVGDKWAIEMNWGWLGYSSTKTKADLGGGVESTNTNSSFGLDIDYTSFGLGARWYF